MNFKDNFDGKYDIYNYHHALSILETDFTVEFDDLSEALSNFSLLKSDVLEPGGRKSPIANKFDSFLLTKGWSEKKFDVEMKIDDQVFETPTHKVDFFKNRIAIELEWNNKDPFFDRDLNNFRLLHSMGALSIGIIVTRATELQEIFNSLDKGTSYGTSTTHIEKLLPRIAGGGAGTCPLLIIGINKTSYIADI
ncbi:MAG: hypothetical protein JXB03_01345 [Spirochaetales bacterium]|nr:hypothetical protein [Spirochaetales bacterium]